MIHLPRQLCSPEQAGRAHRYSMCRKNDGFDMTARGRILGTDLGESSKERRRGRNVHTTARPLTLPVDTSDDT